LFPGHRSSITNVRPIVDATATVIIKIWYWNSFNIFKHGNKWW
jgi:hypothetical protein